MRSQENPNTEWRKSEFSRILLVGTWGSRGLPEECRKFPHRTTGIVTKLGIPYVTLAEELARGVDLLQIATANAAIDEVSVDTPRFRLTARDCLFTRGEEVARSVERLSRAMDRI